ncbi:hypothetical protein [Pedobacter sp. BMA]|uniref:hypothetical protein n=1 Tax=Pedobacter sp. BMA TaxID=1663685 RepID=UPI000649A12C|nr:hypothetical protein [Pedobacter sp. BMA]KLT64019.1 hypothetical protein AB669_18305 [Pedobacter sp. BMA]
MTSHELARKLLDGPNMSVYIPLKGNNSNLEEVEEVEYAIIGSQIYLLGNSESEWIKNMYEEWGLERVFF